MEEKHRRPMQLKWSHANDHSEAGETPVGMVRIFLSQRS